MTLFKPRLQYHAHFFVPIFFIAPITAGYHNLLEEIAFIPPFIMRMPLQSKYRAVGFITTALFVTVLPSYAVLPFVITTNGSGVMSGGSWTGNGTVQNNISPGTFSGSVISQIAVQDFSSGVFTVNTIGGNVISSGRFKDPGAGFSQTITLTGGGTADLRLANSNSYDGGASAWNSIGLTGFSGNVTAIEFYTRFESPVAGRDETLADLGSRGMGGGVALVTAGAGQTASSFTVGLDYGGVYSNANPNILTDPYNPALPGYVSGIPGTAIPYQQAGFVASTPGTLSFTSNAFTGISNGNDNFLLIRGYDYDGSGNGYQAADASRVYITTQKWTITKDDNSAFASDTLFVFSMDGQQYGSGFQIPETSSALLGLSALALLSFRRRRA